MTFLVVSLITIVGCWLITKIPSYAALVFHFCVVRSRVYTPVGRFANEKAFVARGVVEGLRSINWSDTVTSILCLTSSVSV